MINNNIAIEQSGEIRDESLLSEFISKYVPYWPVFLCVVLLSIGGAYTYLRYTTPIYEISANILIKDERKGINESQIAEALNPFNSSKIVENEIVILRSRALMEEVVKNLRLYAPVFYEGNIRKSSAYVLSPVKVEVKDPSHIKPRKKLSFQYNDTSGLVSFDGKNYRLNEWMAFNDDSLRFIANPDIKDTVYKNIVHFELLNANDLAGELANEVIVDPVSKLSTVVNLTIEDDVPARGENILNELIQVYNKASIQDKNTLAANTLAFVEQRLRFLVNELDSVESELQKFKTTENIVDISAQGQIFLQNVGSSDMQVSEINIKQAVLEQVEQYVISKEKGSLIVPSTFGLNDPLLSQMLEKLYELEMQYQKLKKTTAENNPILLSIRAQIDEVKPAILENLRDQKRNLAASKNNLLNTTHQYSSTLRRIPKKERELLDISRQQIIKNNIYTFLLQKREETALSFGSTVADTRIVDVAKSSGLPIRPRKEIVYAFAFFSGLLLTIGILALREVLNNKILYRKEIEKYVSWPIIGEIQESETKETIVTGKTNRTAISEQFRHVRTSLAYMGIDKKKNRILITSSISGEGKSFVSINLAISLSLTDKKVALLELDLRKPKISPLMNMKQTMGITNYLIGSADIDQIIFPTNLHPNLYFVPSGPIPPNPSELIMHERMEEMMSQLAARFDYIIIDSAPVVPVTDAYILTKFCDATLYIIRHGITPKIYVKRLEANNAMKSFRNVGIIFNGLKKRGFGQYGYGYGYSSANEKGGYYINERGAVEVKTNQL